VVHKHAARRLHFDLRLELDGVLRSWAVPKGPSPDPKEKRLAVQVEDHPLEYGDFEGLIPAGNYGAGAVILWDRGEWIPLDDPHQGLASGKLLFELRGYKLRGRWTLVKLKKSEKDWLLIKERDAWVRSGPVEWPEESVLSGLTVEALGAGETPATLVRRELERLKTPRRAVRLSALKPMLAETRESAFTRPGWLFELKLDGYRLLAAREGDAAELRTRNGGDLTATFPEVARAVRAIPAERVVLDGELVVLDPAGRPSFQLLQERAHISRAVDARSASVDHPATYFAFDLPGFEDFDLRGLALAQRKRLLRMLLPPLGPVRFLEDFAEEGEKLMEQVARMGLEGVMAKRADSPYRAGRSSEWLKIRSDRAGDFAVVGFTPPKGSRAGIGALLLADKVGGKLVYAGRAGSGLTDRQLGELRKRLDPRRLGSPPCGPPVAPAGSAGEGAGPPGAAGKARDWIRALPDLKGSSWVEPELVCEVRFKEWTREGLLRQPVFLRFRDDKTVEECERQGFPQSPPADPPPPEAARAREASRSPASQSSILFTNTDKVFWPDEGYTKGDLLEYYRAVSPWLLPYLRHRPLVLTRYPDGITGKSFYQKDAPEYAPGWVRTERMWSEHTQREIRYFVCDDEASLLYLVNLGSIPLHVWASRVESVERPDWCVIDLDPKGAPFRDVVRLARLIEELGEEIGLPTFVKTTGSTGLHVLIPLGGALTYQQSRTLAELLSRVTAQRAPEISTLVRQVSQREGKVYLDYLQNIEGQTIVAPFSVRPLPGAPVSMPLKWEEVTPALEPRRYTIRTALQRMRQMKRDPMAPVLERKPDLAAALQRLERRIRETGKEKVPPRRGRSGGG
jgi:bifunctional non-homologous end joining protein LigD